MTLRHRDLDVAAGRNACERVLDGRDQKKQDGKPVLRKLNDGDPARAEILLIAQVLVGGNEYIKPSGFGGGEKFAVVKCIPAFLVASANLKSGQAPPQWLGHAMIEEDALHTIGTPCVAARAASSTPTTC